MFGRLILILITGYPAFHYTDLDSPSWLYGVALPIIAFSSAISLCIWFVVFFHKKGITQTFTDSSGFD